MKVNKSGRLFAFGCSFTNYDWATWADILGQEYNYYENWGLIAGGNQFIFNSLIECNQRNKFTQDDTIIIMWTNVAREDRYINGNWIRSGNIYTQKIYDEAFVKRFTDDRGYLIRDLATISAAFDLLTHWQVNFEFLSMVPINNGQYYKDTIPIDEDIRSLYQSTIDKIKPSIFETVFNYDWYSRFSKEEYLSLAGASWPLYEDFVTGSNGAESQVQDEVKNFRRTYLLQDIPESIFDIFKWDNFKKRQGKIRDTHARPIDYLDYLNIVLPEIELSQNTLDWVGVQQTNAIQKIKFIHPKITRL